MTKDTIYYLLFIYFQFPDLQQRLIYGVKCKVSIEVNLSSRTMLCCIGVIVATVVSSGLAAPAPQAAPAEAAPAVAPAPAPASSPAPAPADGSTPAAVVAAAAVVDAAAQAPAVDSAAAPTLPAAPELPTGAAVSLPAAPVAETTAASSAAPADGSAAAAAVAPAASTVTKREAPALPGLVSDRVMEEPLGVFGDGGILDPDTLAPRGERGSLSPDIDTAYTRHSTSSQY